MTGGPVRVPRDTSQLPQWLAAVLLTIFLGTFELACETGSADVGLPKVVAEATPAPVVPSQPATPALAIAGDAPETGRAGDTEPGDELSWTFARGPFGPTDVVISLPSARSPEQRFPVLVTFHGRGESAKGSRRGSRGWIEDYGLIRAIERLGAPPLRAEDFESFVTEERLARFNAALGERPYEGLIVVCPFLPDVLKGARAFEEAGPLADFVVDVLLPRVYAKTPAQGTAASTGIDGVSLGGRASLLVGLTRPLAFGSVGALQAALDPKELARFSGLAARAAAQNPALRLRLLTSDEDYFQKENQRLSVLLERGGVAHQFVRVIGTHSYRFNRGPGSLEMLLFHDRALRGDPSL